jgi:hypothetical protein
MIVAIAKEHLDIPICDHEENATNKETYREFIRTSETEFGMEPRDLDSMDDGELTSYLDFLDYLWEK